MRTNFSLNSVLCLLLFLALPVGAQNPNVPLYKQDANALYLQAVTLMAEGKNQEAIPLLQTALKVQRINRDRAGEAAVRNATGVAYADSGRPELAFDYFDTALPLLRETKNRLGESVALAGLGKIYTDRGQFERAIDSLNQALQIQRKLKNGLAEGISLNSLGEAYLQLGQSDVASQYYQQALILYRALKDRGGEATALGNLGVAYTNLGQHEQAISVLDQALDIQRERGDRGGAALTNFRLGSAYANLEQWGKAVSYHEQALPVIRAIGNRHLEAAILNKLGWIAYTRNDAGGAATYFQQALPLVRMIKDRQSEGTILGNLMLADKAMGRASYAVLHGQQAIAIFEQIRANIGGLGADVEKVFVADRQETYRGLAELFIEGGNLDEAQRVLGLLKQEEYRDFTRPAPSVVAVAQAPNLSSAEQERQNRYHEASGKFTTLGKERGELLAVEKRSSAQEQRLAQLDAELEVASRAFNAFLEQLPTQFASARASQDKIHELKDAQALMGTLRELGEGTVILYTIMGKDKYSVILLTPDVRKAAQTSISAGELERKIQQFRVVLQNPGLDPQPLARELYEILVAPVAKDLEGAGAKTLMWSLDGALRYLPVSALHDGQKYLVERYRNTVFTPASQANLKDEPQTNWKGVGFGVSKALDNFIALPAVPAELDGIIRDTSTNDQTGVLEGRVLLDEAFTSASLQTALRQRYPLVHIASHFSFQPGSDADSYLLLGDGSRLSLAKIENDYQNLFAGVDLLTLSACDTASGGAGANGKEVEGFGVLAQRQGAKAVVASLWPVADASTQSLMQTFYQRHATNTNEPKIEALRQAQLALLRGTVTVETRNLNLAADRATKGNAVINVLSRGTNDKTGNSDSALFVGSPLPVAYKHNAQAPYAHPYYWAPFILIGNWK